MDHTAAPSGLCSCGANPPLPNLPPELHRRASARRPQPSGPPPPRPHAGVGVAFAVTARPSSRLNPARAPASAPPFLARDSPSLDRPLPSRCVPGNTRRLPAYERRQVLLLDPPPPAARHIAQHATRRNPPCPRGTRHAPCAPARRFSEGGRGRRTRRTAWQPFTFATNRPAVTDRR